MFIWRRLLYKRTQKKVWIEAGWQLRQIINWDWEAIGCPNERTNERTKGYWTRPSAHVKQGGGGCPKLDVLKAGTKIISYWIGVDGGGCSFWFLAQTSQEKAHALGLSENHICNSQNYRINRPPVCSSHNYRINGYLFFNSYSYKINGHLISNSYNYRINGHLVSNSYNYMINRYFVCNLYNYRTNGFPVCNSHNYGINRQFSNYVTPLDSTSQRFLLMALRTKFVEYSR